MMMITTEKSVERYWRSYDSEVSDFAWVIQLYLKNKEMDMRGQ